MATQYTVEFTAEVKDAIASLQKLSEESTKQLESIQKQAEQTSKATSAIFALDIAKVGINAVIAFGSAVVDALAGTIDAAVESEDAINGLNVALQQSGQYSSATSKDLQNFSKQLQNTTKYSDEAILSTTSYLATLTKLDKDGLKKATQASVDLAAALGIDLHSATELVAKASEGNVSALKRYGIQVQQGTSDSQTFANTLQTLNERFGGRAAKEVNTYSGAIAQASNSFNELEESIGNSIVKNKSVIEAIKIVKSVFEASSDVVDEFSKQIGDILSKAILLSIDAFQNFIKITNVALSSILDISDGVLFLKDKFVSVTKSVTGFLASIGQTAIAQQDISDAVENETAAIDENIGKRAIQSEERKKQINDFLSKLDESITKVRQQTESESSNASSFVDSVNRKISSVQSLNEEQLKALKSSLDKISSELSAEKSATIEIEKLKRGSLLDRIEALKRTEDQEQEIIKNAAKNNLIDWQSADDLRVASAKKANAAILDEIKKLVVDGINKVLSGINTVLTFAVSIADAKKSIDSLQSQLDNLDTTAQVSLQANIDDLSKSLEKSLNDVIETNAKAIQDFETSIPGQLQELADSIKAASDKRIKDLQDEATRHEQDIKEAADLQLKLDTDAATKQAELDEKQAIEKAQNEFEKGSITQDELNQKILDIQTQSAIDLQAKKDQLALDSANKLESDIQNLRLATEQAIRDERLKVEQEISDEVSKKRTELEDQLSKMRLDSQAQENDIRTKNEEEIAKKQLELEDQISKQRLDLEKQITDSQTKLNDQTDKSAAGLVGGIAGAITDVFLPGIGAAAGQFVTLLAGSAEGLSDAIDSLFESIPTVITNLTNNLPTIIDSLAKGMPKVAEALAEASPQIIATLVTHAPEIIIALLDSLNAAIKGLLNGIIDVINEIPGIDIPHLASGGTVPQGFSQDNFPANLSSGEMVIPKNDVSRLNDFLDKQDSNNGLNKNDITSIVSAIDRNSQKNLSVSIKVGESELSKAILNLNRQGFRLA